MSPFFGRHALDVATVVLVVVVVVLVVVIEALLPLLIVVAVWGVIFFGLVTVVIALEAVSVGLDFSAIAAGNLNAGSLISEP